MDYRLYSDGGGNGQTDIALSCIVDDLTTYNRYYLTAYLGKGTNNEAEILAGLLGISLVKAIINIISSKRTHSLLWVADSEYALKSASEYIYKWIENDWRKSDDKKIKNLGIWKAYLELVQNLELTTEHVRGHQGHEENELCDNASTWTRKYAPRHLNTSGGFSTVSISGKDVESKNWFLIDAREWLDSFRKDDPKKKDIAFYVTAFTGKN